MAHPTALRPAPRTTSWIRARGDRVLAEAAFAADLPDLVSVVGGTEG